jgi:hypothetical protein
MNAAGVGTFSCRRRSVARRRRWARSFTREQFESVYCYGVGIVEGTRSCSRDQLAVRRGRGYSEVRTIGAYLQQQLAWRDRLFLAASVRGDDNSAFGQDFGFIYYPGASASWVISEEPFFPQTNIAEQPASAHGVRHVRAAPELPRRADAAGAGFRDQSATAKSRRSV